MEADQGWCGPGEGDVPFQGAWSACPSPAVEIGCCRSASDSLGRSSLSVVRKNREHQNTQTIKNPKNTDDLLIFSSCAQNRKVNS